MLVIRLFRVGKKNQPAFKIVVTDKRKPPRAGRFVEEVGFYDPFKKEKVLKGERIKYWLSVGAKLSDTVHNLLVSEKIIEGRKIDVHKKAKKKAEKEAPPEKPAEEKLKKEVTAEKTPKTEEHPKGKEAAKAKAEPKVEVSKKEEKKEEKPEKESPKA